MPSVVIHTILPLLFLLAIPQLDRRKVWMLLPLTYVPDLDFFLPVHRALLSNIWILLPILAWTFYHLRPAHRDRDKVEWGALALVYLGTHLLMDIFAGGIVPLWPLNTYTVCYVAGIQVVTATTTLDPFFEACHREGIPIISEVYPWISTTEAAMLAFLVPATVTVAILQWRYAAPRRADQ